MYTLKRFSSEEIIPLRHKVLRPGEAVETALFPEDNFQSTIHYGLSENGAIKVCLTLLKTRPLLAEDADFLSPGAFKLYLKEILQNAEAGQADAWQLRGMAADPEVQGKGLGGKLIQFAVNDALREGYSVIFWCNARLKAVPFYQKNGWQISSEMFEVPKYGPHHRMIFVNM